jgi:hypothetical protein
MEKVSLSLNVQAAPSALHEIWVQEGILLVLRLCESVYASNLCHSSASQDVISILGCVHSS